MARKNSFQHPEVRQLAEFFLDQNYSHSVGPLFRWFCRFYIQSFYPDRAYDIPKDVAPILQECRKLYGEVVASLPPFEDVLGQVYMDLASHGARSSLAQFFTPQHLADAMSLMSLGDDDPENGRLVRAIDPSSGSGVMMLSFARTVLTMRGQEALKKYSFTCVDLDSVCADMSAVQFLASIQSLELPIGEVRVWQGNSLMPMVHWTPVLHLTHEPMLAPAMEEALAHLTEEPVHA